MMDINDALVGPLKKVDEPKTSFGRFLRSKEFSDVKIISSDGKEFCAHKVILSAGSEVFDVMFKAGMTEATTGTIKLDDMSASAVNFLLNFLYGGNNLPFTMNDTIVTSAVLGSSPTTTSPEDPLMGTSEKTPLTVEEVLYIAAKYKLQEVLDHVDRSLRRMCNEENAEELFEFSKMYSLDCKEFLKNFIKGHPRLLDRLLEP